MISSGVSAASLGVYDWFFTDTVYIIYGIIMPVLMFSNILMDVSRILHLLIEGTGSVCDLYGLVNVFRQAFKP